jgi:hypothetical protein
MLLVAATACLSARPEAIMAQQDLPSIGGLERLEKRQSAPASDPQALYFPWVSARPDALAAPRLAASGGFHEVPFRVRIEAAPGDLIRYTLDGSAPSETHGQAYSEAIRVAETTVLRARAFRRGQAPSAIATRSFLFLSDVLRQSADPDPARFPPFWGFYSENYEFGEPVKPDYGMDPRVVDDPQVAGRIAADLRELPSLSVVMDPVDLFGMPQLYGDRPGIYSHPLEEGSEWERAASAELIFADGQTGFQIDCGIRIAGMWSRKPDVTPKHSFSLRFRSRYGPSRLRYPLFPDSPVDSFDTLRLRAGQADSFPYLPRSLNVHDEWGRRTQAAMGGPSAHGRFVHLYLNGQYWGLYNLAEEPTAAFAASQLGGDEAEYDVIKGLEVVEQVHGKAVGRGSYEVEDGDAAAFEALLAIPEGGPASDPAQLARMAALLDIDRFIDYHLIEIYTANDDWLTKNWRALRRRVGDGRWQFLIWDIERSVFLRAIDPRCGSDGEAFCDLWKVGEKYLPVEGDIADTAGVMGLHAWLSGSPEYRMRFADHASQQLQDGGLLSPAAVRDRYAKLLDQVDRAIVGESARWGDATPRPRTRSENITPWSLFWANTPDRVQRRSPHWVVERDRLLDQAIPARTRIVIDQLCRNQLLPPVAPLRIRSRSGGGQGESIEIQALGSGCPGARSDGSIFYTLDGSDPRLVGSGSAGRWWDGQLAPSARAYGGAVPVEGYLYLRSRMAVPTPEGLIWGPLVEIQRGLPRLEASEIRYHPRKGQSEFLEIHNLETAPVDLSGARFEGITLTLPAGSILPPEGYLLVADTLEAFHAEHPGLAVAAEYSGGLSNSGERIRLLDQFGRRLIDLRYSDAGFWPRGADLLGHSLVPVEPGLDPNRFESWRESALPGGSPGAEDPPSPWPDLRLNEVLANSSPPYEDAVEVYNASLAPVAIGGWLLSDDPTALAGFRIPAGTIVPAGGFAAFYEQNLRIGNGGRGFALSSAGESLLLAATDASGKPSGFVRGLDLGPTGENISWGPYRNRQGELELVALAAPSFGRSDPSSSADFRMGRGAANREPRVGTVMLSEIMVRPADGQPEWIELENRSDQSVYLFDPAAPERTWAFTEGIDFAFPSGAFIPAGGRALVLGQDPIVYRAEHRPPPDIALFGPFRGRLDDGGEALTLSRPFDRDAEDGTPMWILEERLRYDDAPPWPALSVRGGISLERLQPPTYANDHSSWIALHEGGTPGRINTQPARIFLPWLEAR